MPLAPGGEVLARCFYPRELEPQRLHLNDDDDDDDDGDTRGQMRQNESK